MAECSKKDSSWTIKCVSILPVCCKEYPAVLPELSTLQFLVFPTVKKSWSDRLGSSYRVRSQRWELGPDPAHWDQTGGCFSASGHGGLNEEMMEREEDIFQKDGCWGKRRRREESQFFYLFFSDELPHTYVEWVEVWEATHRLFQQTYRIQLRKAGWILYILQRIQKNIC